MDLQSAPIRLMDAAITKRLRMAFPPKDFDMERIPAVLTIDEFKRVTRQLPFIGLAWMGLQPDRDAGRAIKGVANWRLVLMAKASSSLDARLKGDRFDIGLDAMVDVASVLMQGCTYDDIGASTVTRAEAIYADGWADNAIVLAQVDFDISYTAAPSIFQIKTLDDLKALNVSWLLDDDADSQLEETLPIGESNG